MNGTETEYWAKFYKNYNNKEPSNFAIFINNYFKNKNEKLSILDCGCGNGRDSYFLSNNFNVMGIDNSNQPDNKKCKFLLGNFVTFPKINFDIMY